MGLGRSLVVNTPGGASSVEHILKVRPVVEIWVNSFSPCCVFHGLPPVLNHFDF